MAQERSAMARNFAFNAARKFSANAEKATIKERKERLSEGPKHKRTDIIPTSSAGIVGLERGGAERLAGSSGAKAKAGVSGSSLSDRTSKGARNGTGQKQKEKPQ